MNNYNNKKSSFGNIILIFSAAFVLYNVVLFLVANFDGHGAGFWLSYVFMLIAFGSLAVCGALVSSRGAQTKDWIFGFPVIKHSFIYLISELVVSIIFMALDASDLSWKAGFVVQRIRLAVFIGLVATTFMAKSTVEKTELKVKDASTYIRLLETDAEMVAAKADDASTKAAFLKLAEAIRYSDPMSNPSLFELEKQIAQHINTADRCVFAKDYAGAIWCCNKAQQLLSERNMKTKALK